MKTTLSGLALAALLALPARAAIIVPGANGSDGALDLTTGNLGIDLSLAARGEWDSASPVPGKGLYDPDQWAVVFHYTHVNIPAGRAVSFRNNASRAPVVWLVSGNVTIDGQIILRGQYGKDPGPGGFRAAVDGKYAGLGPGGAPKDGQASYGTKGAEPSAGPYGSTAILPLIGGSGDSANYPGAGAILIAATGTITINGAIIASGGTGAQSGGAIRLVADAVKGTGTLDATGGTYGGGDGRIRVEAPGGLASTISTTPTGTSRNDFTTAVIFPPDTAPSVRIVSIGTEQVPADPLAQFGTGADTAPDIIGPIPVVIETKNIPTTAPVNLRVVPLSGDAGLIPATLTSGDADLALWTAMVSPTDGTAVFQVRVEAR